MIRDDLEILPVQLMAVIFLKSLFLLRDALLVGAVAFIASSLLGGIIGYERSHGRNLESCMHRI